MTKRLKPSPYQILRERWLRGRLGYKLHAGQKRLFEAFMKKSIGQIFVSECSRQFGKSFFWVVVALALAYALPKARIKYGTAFHTDLVEFILPAFDAVLEDCPEDIKAKYKVQGSKFVVYNGSEIKLVGLDRKPNGLRGNQIDLIIIDEAGFTDKLDYLYKSVIIPATTHRPDCRVVFSSTPPSTPAHDFLDYVQKAELEDAYIKMTIYDNPMVTQATIDRLMRESGGVESTTWRREYLCEHITDLNLAIVGGWNEKNVQEVARDDYYPYYHKYISMDLGVKDHTAVIFSYYDFLQAKLIVEDEFVISGPSLTTEVLQREIKKKQVELWGESQTYRRISDNNNPLLIQDLSFLHGLHFTPTDKGSLEQMVNAVKLMVANDQVIVHPRCKQMKGCLKYGVWNEKRSEFARSKVYGHFDALAALIYLVRNLDKATNPIPQAFGVDFSNQILFSRKQDSHTANTLRDAFGLRRA